MPHPGFLQNHASSERRFPAHSLYLKRGPMTGYVIHRQGGGLESTIFINLIPPTVVAWLLQYSGSKVEHRVGFSSH